MGITMEHIIGRGRSTADLRGVFAPPALAGSEPGSILSTFRGIGRSGRGREGMLDLFERLRLITSEQRTGVSATAVDTVLDTAQHAAFVASPGGRSAAEAMAAAAAGSTNPIYRGLYAQSLLGEVEAPAALVDDVIRVAVEPGPVDDVARSLADDVVHAVTRPVVLEDALRGAMGFSAGVDDTVRLLARAARALR